jgi:hypothetical protein
MWEKAVDTNTPATPESLDQAIEQIAERKGGKTKWFRVIIAALSGLPWVGQFLGAANTYWSETSQEGTNEVLAQYLLVMKDEAKKVQKTIIEMMQRINTADPRVADRLEDPAFLDIVRKGFQAWAAGEGEVRREMVRNLLCHAAQTRICTDDVVKLFIQWIAQYSELHFKVIRSLYAGPGSTRADMWDDVHGVDVREDSAEADLFKLLTQELSMGHVMRQIRPKDGQGNFLTKIPTRRRQPRPRVMKSAFDDKEPYELTELGKQFVRYTMENVMPELGSVPAL